MNKSYVVDKICLLGDFLVSVGYSKKDAKRLLSNNKIIVNDKKISKYTYELKGKETVFVNPSKTTLDVLYEDDYLLVVDKPANLLTVATTSSNHTLYRQVSDYVKQRNKNNKVFIINRLDRETSGLVMFAKVQKVKFQMQNTWSSVIRKYIAVVIGKTDNSGVIKSYLSEDKGFNVKSSTDGKLAITEYKKIKESKEYTWLDVNIKTGRKNQIRVHLKDIGCIIRGDVKYGSKKDKRMYLHAYKLEFKHPVTNKIIKVKSLMPEGF